MYALNEMRNMGSSESSVRSLIGTNGFLHTHTDISFLSAFGSVYQASTSQLDLSPKLMEKQSNKTNS